MAIPALVKFNRRLPPITIKEITRNRAPTATIIITFQNNTNIIVLNVLLRSSDALLLYASFTFSLPYIR